MRRYLLTVLLRALNSLLYAVEITGECMQAKICVARRALVRAIYKLG